MGRPGVVAVAAFSALSLCALGAHAAEVHVTGDLQRQVYVPGSGFTTQDLGNYDHTTGFSGDGVHFDEVIIEEQSGIHLLANSYGGPGFVQAHTYAGWNRQVSSDHSVAYTLTATSHVAATFDDVLISSSGGSPTVMTSIHFHLSGAQTAGSFLGSEGTSAQTSYVVSVEPLGAFGFFAQGGLGTTNGDAPQVYTVSGTPIDSPIFAGTFTTVPFSAPVNTPFSVTFSLNTTAEVSGSNKDDFILYANNDFGSTLRFVTDGPVFDLSEGYTADSASANIADNAFTFVPEPGPAPLTALLTLAAVARARRRHEETDFVSTLASETGCATVGAIG